MPSTNTELQDQGWYLVIGEQEITQFTDEILDHPEAGNPLEILFHWIAAKAGKWSPVDPDNPNTTKCCKGTIKKMTIAGDGDINIYLQPCPDCEELLAEGQECMVCELPWAQRGDFKGVLKLLSQGDKIEICGYHVIDGGHGGQHELHPITSIDPFPD